jgi:ZIP family zinc transporter
MAASLLFGVIASSALVIGALIGVKFELPKRLLAILLSFAAGALITALTFELFEDAYERGGIVNAAVGLFAGALVFTALSAFLDRLAQPGRKSKPADEVQGSVSSTPMPPPTGPRRRRQRAEPQAWRCSPRSRSTECPRTSRSECRWGKARAVALLAAIFVSDLPEALVGAASMRTQGRSTGCIIGLWTACAVLLVAAVVVGAGPLANSDPAAISLPLAFAAGAVIASLADTLMPEAFEHGGPAVAMSTAAGFVLSFVLSLV